MSALAALAQTGANIGTAAIQNEYNKAAAERQQKWTEKNMQQAFQNQLTLDRLATPLAVQGIRDAGLSVAAMNGPMKPSGVPAAPQGAVQAVPTIEPVSIAQTRLLNAQAEKQEIENARSSEEDDVVKDAWLKQMRQQIDIYRSMGLDEAADKLQAQYDGISDGSVKFNVGTLNANLRSIEAHTKSLESFTNEIRSLLSQIGVKRLLNTHPGIEADMVMQKLALDAAQSYYLSQSGNEAQARLQEIAAHTQNLYKEVDKMESEKKLTDVQARKIKNEDINSLLEDGDIGSAVRAGLVQGGLSFAHGAGQGAGLALGAKTAGLGGLAGSTPLVTRNMLGNAAKRAANPIAKAGIDRDTFEALSKRIGYDNALTLYNGYVADPYRSYGSYKGFNDWLTKNNNGHGWRK